MVSTSTCLLLSSWVPQTLSALVCLLIYPPIALLMFSQPSMICLEWLSGICKIVQTWKLCCSDLQQ